MNVSGSKYSIVSTYTLLYIWWSQKRVNNKISCISNIIWDIPAGCSRCFWWILQPSFHKTAVMTAEQDARLIFFQEASSIFYICYWTVAVESCSHTYVCYFHFFLVINALGHKAALVDEMVQTGVIFHKEFLCTVTREHRVIIETRILRRRMRQGGWWKIMYDWEDGNTLAKGWDKGSRCRNISTPWVWLCPPHQVLAADTRG